MFRAVRAQRFALHRDPVHQAPLPGVVVERVVPGGAIVPERDATDVPAEPAGVIFPGSDAIEIFE